MKPYDYYNNKLYKVYSKSHEDYFDVVVVREGNIVKLLGSTRGYIYIYGIFIQQNY